jgi:dipeptidyl aminopeptidase/acylaminoacyl peptidase
MSRLTRCSPGAFIAFSLLVPIFAPAQGTPGGSAPAPDLDQILSRQNRAHTVAQVAVSPDGERVAWLEGAQIHMAPLDQFDQSRPIAAGSPGQTCSASGFVWSPDSASIAFLSDCADPGEQLDLFLSHLDGTPAIRLSQLHGYVDAPAFSPDGRSIAFLYVDGATRPPGALSAETAPSGVIGEDHIEIQRVAEIPAGAPQPAAPTFMTPPNLHVFEFDWSPDSKSLAYIAADPPGENNWWVAKLYTTKSDICPIRINGVCPDPSLSLSKTGAPGPSRSGTGEIPTAGAQSNAHAEQNGGGRVGWDAMHPVEQGTPTPILSPAGAPGPSHSGTGEIPTTILSPAEVAGPLHGLQIAQPRWSPDGKSIAFIGGLMSDQGVTGGDVWIVPAAGGQPTNLTPNRNATAEWIAWDGNSAIYASELAASDSRLVRLRLPQNPGTPGTFDPPLFSIPGSVGIASYDSNLSASAARSLFVFQSSSFDTPPEIFALRAKTPTAPDSSRLTQLSHFNDGLKPSWGDSVSLSWKNDGFNIQGWLLLPEHYDPSKKYPLLVAIHGGPASSVASRWDGGAGGFSSTVFSALGYFVLMPNPRGSYGQGEAFTQANRKDFGYGDLRDILAGVDTVLAKYPVDPNRLGIAGWSYGGFMSMFAITQTHRFHAAIVGAGISDWLSYYGENSIDQWMIPYFGASVYDDPRVYARSSAIDFIKNASTPTLLVVGDRDGECPAPQSFEFWHALRDLHVPVQFVVYPNEGHGFSDPADRRDSLERAVNWLAQYLPPTP